MEQRNALIRLAASLPKDSEERLNILAVLKVAKEPPLREIAQLEDMTDRNDHGGALLLLAKMLGEKKEMAKLEHINALHILYRSLIRPLSILRDDTRDTLWGKAKKVRYSDGTTLYDHIP